MSSRYRFIAGFLVVALVCIAPAAASAATRQQPPATAEWSILSGVRALWQAALRLVLPSPAPPAHRLAGSAPVCLGPGMDPNGGCPPPAPSVCLGPGADPNGICPPPSSDLGPGGDPDGA